MSCGFFIIIQNSQKHCFLMNIPNFLKEQKLNEHRQISTSSLPTFQVRCRGSQFPARIYLHDDTVKMEISQTYQIDRLALLSVAYSEGGEVLSIAIEQAGESLTITHDNHQQLGKLLEQLVLVLSYKGFNDYYKPLKRLGRGNFASVYLVEHKFSKKVFAAKVFSRCQQYIEMDGKEALENQISIMRSIRHDNIVKIYGVHETQNLVYLILEYLSGGTLQDYMRSRLNLTGQQIYSIIKQSLSALQYLDSKDIMHRDLKPSNIMQRKDTGEWVFTDFGLAAKSNTRYLYQKCGTPGFVAPEILKLENIEDRYNQTCDMFSLGIIVYTLVVGRQPFQGEENQEEDIYELTKKCEIRFNEREKEELHPQIIKLIMGMLESEPSRRLTPKKALQSSVIADKEVSESLVEYFEKQRERAMNKVLQWANNVNIV